MFHAIESGDFGSPEEFKPLIESIRDHGDYYLVTDDFDLFLEAHKKLKKYMDIMEVMNMIRVI